MLKTFTPGVVVPLGLQYFDGALKITTAQAQALAKRCPVVVGVEGSLKPHLSEMRSANSECQIFEYMKGTFTYDKNQPEDVYAHDANGRRCTGLNFPGTYLIDQNSQAAVAFQIDVANSRIADGFDGVFLDTCGTAPLSHGWLTALPINSKTGLAWTESEWINANSQLITTIAEAVSPALVIFNGLRDGVAYFGNPPMSRLLDGADGGMSEGWVRGGGNPIGSYPAEKRWKAQVDAIVDCESRGKAFHACTKIWVYGTQAQKEAWYEFTVASFLLGANGRSALTVLYDEKDSKNPKPHDWLNLGAALANYSRQPTGIYWRQFANGAALVNPTTKNAAATLDRAYKNLAGHPVSAGVTLQPHSSLLLTT